MIISDAAIVGCVAPATGVLGLLAILFIIPPGSSGPTR